MLLGALGLTLAQQKLWIPFLLVAILWLWLFVFAGFVPVLIESIREGAISIPPQTVRRHDRPVFFWLVAITHAIYIVAGVSILAYKLWTSS